MLNSIISESRHKFVYFDESEDIFSSLDVDYPVLINSENPIVVHIRDLGLPNIYKKDSCKDINKDMITSFHRRYYELLVFYSIIDILIKHIDVDLLNKKLGHVIELCCLSSKYEIKDVLMLRKYLINSKDIYKNEYYNYIQSGKVNFYDKLPIPFVIMDTLIPTLKECIGLKSYFSILFELDKNISIYNQVAVNDYISSRCNSYLSINVFLSDNCWNCYYNSNGVIIQNVHDYTDINLNKDKIRKKIVQK